MLERMASDDAEPCIQCNGLVGGSPRVPPHQGLQRSENEGRALYICVECGVLWRVGALGWARVVSSVEGV